MSDMIRQGMALADYIQQYDAEGPFEIIDGEVIPVSPSVFGSGHVAAWLYQRFILFLAAIPDFEQRVGSVFAEMPFVLPDTPLTDWVTGSRVPDLMFVRAERLTAYKLAVPEWRLQPLALVPDWVVEVVSSTDRIKSVLEKVARYLGDGVSIIWIVDPKRQTVTVYTPDDQPVTLLPNDTLSGGVLLPGFSLSVHALLNG